MLGHPDNYILPIQWLLQHIVPEWYFYHFTQFTQCQIRLDGVIMMFGNCFIVLLSIYLDRNKKILALSPVIQKFLVILLILFSFRLFRKKSCRRLQVSWASKTSHSLLLRDFSDYAFLPKFERYYLPESIDEHYKISCKN